ncbi:hypothetical protein [Chryseobacterium sp.]|uniref:hypothetical protein n=1 Tax=Chryseobacterium sp. TaxID=1871047 RepID=UPI0024E23FEF|nr:hypothetical protein [Chryseobacterium sp.]
MSLIITKIVNGSKPNDEEIWLKAETKINTKGYAVVDRTFDDEGNISNEFRHIYVLPSIDLEENQKIIIFIGTGTNSKKKFTNGKYYYACYWGSKHCILNDNGDDTITLIKYSVIDHEQAPAL